MGGVSVHSPVCGSESLLSYPELILRLCRPFAQPAVSIGNVGQLAVDLLVHTLKLTRVGVLDSQYVLPSVGNDAYTESGTGGCTLVA